MNYSIIIPIYNEESFLSALINEIKPLSLNNEIIFIDDGSTDNSLKILQSFDEFTIISNQKRLGKGSSIIKALNYAKGRYIILFDGDLEIDTKELNLVISHHQLNPSLIIKGNRFNSLNKNVKSVYDIGNLFFNKFFNMLYGTEFYDIFCCLIVIEKRLVKSFNLESKNFGIETEIMSNIAQKKFPFLELDIKYLRRSSGKKLKFIHSLEILSVMIKKRLN